MAPSSNSFPSGTTNSSHFTRCIPHAIFRQRVYVLFSSFWSPPPEPISAIAHGAAPKRCDARSRGRRETPSEEEQASEAEDFESSARDRGTDAARDSELRQASKVGMTLAGPRLARPFSTAPSPDHENAQIHVNRSFCPILSCVGKNCATQLAVHFWESAETMLGAER